MTYAATRVLASMSSVLILIGVALFFAHGLETAVSWLVNRRVPRWAAVTAVLAIVFALIARTLAAAVPALVAQAHQFGDQLPHYVQVVQDHSSPVGRLFKRLPVQQRITDMLNGSGPVTASGVVQAGKAVFGVVSDVAAVGVLTVYLLADMRRIRTGFSRLIPDSRRPRAILIGDEVVAKFGSYLYGNVLTSVVAGVATAIWCTLLGVPYAVLLGVVVGVLDLFPYGSSIGGAIVTALALTGSIPVAVGTLLVLRRVRLLEDYLLTPKNSSGGQSGCPPG